MPEPVLPPGAPGPIPAAAVILWRPGPDGREVFWVRRGALRFAGGFMAFPGGRLDPADAPVPVPGLSGEDASFTVCAARELFEETGVLLARGTLPSREVREEARRALLAGEAAFGPLLARFGLEVDAEALARAGRWITPDWSPLRYDARLFLTRLPEGEAADVWPGELTSGEWVAASEAVARWERGEVLLHPPNLWGLRCLAAEEPPRCLSSLRAPPFTEHFVTHRVEFVRGLFLAPLRTPTLPPATHTNAFVLALDGGALALVDPGSGEPAELALLGRLVNHLAEEHGPLRELWLTHAHPDHVGGVGSLLAGRPGVTLRAHRETLASLGELGPRRGLDASREAAAGEAAGAALEVKPIFDGELLGGRWRALHTPGHARGHLAFLDERTGALLAGDMVSTLSTIVIDPPEGDLGDYLDSLSRLVALAPRSLFPSHGMPTQGAVAFLEAQRAHRLARLEKVWGALPGALTEVTGRAYDDAPPAALPLAERSCLASLLALERAGRARRVGGRWLPAGDGGDALGRH